MQTAPWVVFDMVGVLAGPSWRDLGDPSRAADWDRFKRGHLSESEFWQWQAGIKYRRLLSYNSEMVSFLERLHGRRVRVAIATNFSRDWFSALFEKRWLPLDASFVSSELGVAKPEDAFWEHVCRVVPQGSILVDDKHENCTSAQRFGLRAVQMSSPDATIKQVEQLLAAG